MKCRRNSTGISDESQRVTQDLTARDDQQQQEINQQWDEINLQWEEINKQRDQLNKQWDKINQQQNENYQLHVPSTSTTKPDAAAADAIQDPVHACVGESVTLQCTAPHTITVLRGVYGHYADDCTSGCCEPSYGDCTELMEDTNPEEWQNIKTSCDGETTCNYVYPGQTIPMCGVDGMPDYSQIFYNCTGSAKPAEFVGFSAYATHSQDANHDEIIRFPSTYVNAGDGYDTTTSIFTCPTTGFYYIYFSVNVATEDNGSGARDHCIIGIRKDGNMVIWVR